MAQVRVGARLRMELPVDVEAIEQVLDDGARLDDGRAVDDEDRRLAERVHALHLRRREQRLLVPLVAHDLVVERELLEQPEEALRPRVVQVVNGDGHGNQIHPGLMP